MNHPVKIIEILIFLVVQSLWVNGQATDHRQGHSIFSVSPNALLNTPEGAQMSGAIKFQLFLGERLSIDADMAFGKDYYRLGPGVIGLPLGLLGLYLGTHNIYSAFFCLLSFEHLAYHIPVNDDLDISPYISVLRLTSSYKHYENPDPGFIGHQFSFASGMQVNKYYGRFIFSPYVEYNLGYKDLVSRFSIGTYFGIYFPGR